MNFYFTPFRAWKYLRPLSVLGLQILSFDMWFGSTDRSEFNSSEPMLIIWSSRMGSFRNRWSWASFQLQRMNRLMQLPFWETEAWVVFPSSIRKIIILAHAHASQLGYFSWESSLVRLRGGWRGAKDPQHWVLRGGTSTHSFASPQLQ